jgi:hypothetical protein
MKLTAILIAQALYMLYTYPSSLFPASFGLFYGFDMN